MVMGGVHILPVFNMGFSETIRMHLLNDKSLEMLITLFTKRYLHNAFTMYIPIHSAWMGTS